MENVDNLLKLKIGIHKHLIELEDLGYFYFGRWLNWVNKKDE